MPPEVANLFANLGAASEAEVFETLLQRPGLRLERIVSCGYPSPPGHWYDQTGEEWVLLARGHAILEFEHSTVTLFAGDHLTIPAHCRHRVAEVSPDAIWLALHFNSP